MAEEWALESGESIRRVDLHKRYGGNRQGGISPSRSSPNLMIFTDPSGHQYGYRDSWDEKGIFHSRVKVKRATNY